MPHTAQKQNCGGDGVTIAMLPHSACAAIWSHHNSLVWHDPAYTLYQPNLFGNRRNSLACTSSLITHLVLLLCVWPTHYYSLGSTEKGFRKKSMKKRLRKKIIGACILQCWWAYRRVGYRNLKSFSAKHHLRSYKLLLQHRKKRR